MRKSTTILILLLPLLSIAQNKQDNNFIYVSGGSMSSSYLDNAVYHGIHSHTDDHKHNCIILNVGYQYRLGKKWRIGPSFTYDHFGVEDRSIEYHAYYYSVRADRIWKETDKAIWYSGISLGARTLKKLDDDHLANSSTKPSYHLHAAGASIKIFNHFLLDLNVGYGVSGIINVGLVNRF